VGLTRISVAHSAGSIWTEWAVPGEAKDGDREPAQRRQAAEMRRGNVFVSTRRRSKFCDGRVDVRGARVILARASSVKSSTVKSSTVRHKLDLGAVVAVCWKCDSASRAGRGQ
jgi:hypothetical protein